MLHRLDLLNGCRDLVAPQLFRERRIAAMIALASPITRRPYTLTCIYRWLKRGRLPIHRRDGKTYAGYSDVVALSLELSAVPP